MTLREIYDHAAKEQKAAENKSKKGKTKEVAPMKFSFERGKTKQQAKRAKERKDWEAEKRTSRRLQRRGLQ